MSVVQVKDCETAADVRQNFREVVAKRRLGRIPAQAPELALVPIPEPDWVPLAVKILPGGIGEWANEYMQPKDDNIEPHWPVEDIIRETARAYGFRVTDLKAARRDIEASHARHVAMLLCKILTQRSLPFIGKMLGGRDHTTILHGVRKLAWLAPQLQAIHTLADPPSAWAATAARLHPLPELTRTYERRLEGK